MELSNELQRIRAVPKASPIVLEILTDQNRCDDRVEFLNLVLPKIANDLGTRYLAVVAAEAGQWRVRASLPATGPGLPTRLLAEALDAERQSGQAEWLASPLRVRGAAGELLVGRWDSAPSTDVAHRFDACSAALGSALLGVTDKHRKSRRLIRLEAILEIAAQWNQNLEMDSLLTQMAETSTRLLGSERASIFLWDRPRRALVGRPALGVEGGELIVPDDAGIVGQVVQTGEVRRVDADANQDAVNRQVDQELGFVTRTLLCVPLRGRRGQILGAFEMINKKQGNFTPEDEAGLMELAAHASIAIENSQQVEQLLASRKQVADQAAAGIQLIGEHVSIRNLRKTIERVAPTDLAVLVLGENGTGKEVVSRMVHYLSRRRNEPFVAVNCAALTETLLESELFGHEKGAFTDAHEARAGKFEVASGGTLFLDEIGDLSLGGQAKLLRVLEDKVVVRVGGTVPITTDTRVIAATNQDLAKMVRERRFREDLFFRLNVVAVQMPPLRERVDDVVVLAEHFLKEFSARARRQPPRLTDAAIKRLRQHAWPGNVRELRNLMERLAYLTSGEEIGVDDLAFIIAPDTAAHFGKVSMEMTLAEATRHFQSDYIHKHIEAAGNNMSDAAKNLGLHRSNLYRKMRQLELPTDEQDEDLL